MRESMLLGSMLNNAESWININKTDLNNLEKPDTILQKLILSAKGSPSKVFMYLELGILPVKYVIMEKRLKFLRYILNEDMSSMIRQVYETLKLDSRKGDFVYLIKQDMEDLDLELTEEEIQICTKIQWKKFIHERVKYFALFSLTEENKHKSKTKHIKFETLTMRKYLEKNQNTSLSKIIFSVRSGTMDIKIWNEWNYHDTLCVMCALEDENIEHFMTCGLYGNKIEIPWTDIFENDSDTQCLIAIEIKRRQHMRKNKIEEVGLPHNLAPLLQISVEQQ